MTIYLTRMVEMVISYSFYGILYVFIKYATNNGKMLGYQKNSIYRFFMIFLVSIFIYFLSAILDRFTSYISKLVYARSRVKNKIIQIARST